MFRPLHRIGLLLVSPTSLLGAVVGLGLFWLAGEAPDDGAPDATAFGPIYAMAYTPDGRALATAGLNDRVRLREPGSKRDGEILSDRSFRVTALAFAPDGKTLATASVEPAGNTWGIKVHPVSGAERVTELTGHTDLVTALAFTPDGKTLASSSLDGTVRLWGPAGGPARVVIRGSQPVHCVAFADGGRTLYTAGTDGAVRRWSADGEPLGALVEHLAPVHNLAVSPDGSTVATWESGSFAVCLWDAATGAKRATARGHTGYVRALAFAPDGALLASGSLDGTVRLWDPADGQLRATLREPSRAGVHSLAFKPDSSTLASGCDAATTVLWNVPRSLLGVASVTTLHSPRR